MAAEDRPRVGLCIRVCNVLGLTVDGSTARKIAFFQSGPSTYDLVTQTPLNTAKSDRLLAILNTGNFILWFRRLLGNRQVEVSKVLYGHGCAKFRANNASGLFALLKAIEAGETSIETERFSIGTVIDIKTLSDFIKRSSAGREAGERPSNKINEMIKTGQLQWKEKRYPNGRLQGYEMPEAAVDTPISDVASDVTPVVASVDRQPDDDYTPEERAEIHERFRKDGHCAPLVTPPSNVPRRVFAKYVPPKKQQQWCRS